MPIKFFLQLSLAGFIFSCGDKSPQSSKVRQVKDVLAMQQRSDGNFDVICSDGSVEVDSPADLSSNNVCPHKETNRRGQILSLIRNSDGTFNIICLNLSRENATADDIVNDRVCLVSSDLMGSPRGETLANTGLFSAPGIRSPEIKWQLSTPAMIRATPVLYKDNLYVGDYAGNFYSVSAKDGSINWKITLPGTILANAFAKNDTAYIGLYEKELVSSPAFYAIDIHTGSIRWAFGNGFVFGTPIVVKDSVVIGIGYHDNAYYSLNTADGSIKWRLSTSYSGPGTQGTINFGTSVMPALNPADLSTIYLATGNGGWGRLMGVETTTGRIKWETIQSGFALFSEALVFDAASLFIGESWYSSFYRVQAADGTTNWRHDENQTSANPNISSISSGAAVDTNSVYFASTFDYKYLFRLEKKSGKILWRRPLEENVESSISITSDGTLYFTDESGKVNAANAETGIESWQFFVDKSKRKVKVSSPIVAKNGHIFVGSGNYTSDGALTCISEK